jgi:hypothetical protein
MAGLLSQENRRALARGLLDTTQAASNSAASTVSAPVDALAWALRKFGAPIPQAPFGGSDWMKAQGLMRDVQSPVANVIGESIGNVLPIVAAAKAPQIAGGLLKAAENASAKAPMNAATRNQAGAIVWHGSPHKFDRFDASKIGTGEGAQAYGHGLYLADDPSVASYYKKAGVQDSWTDDGPRMTEAVYRALGPMPDGRVLFGPIRSSLTKEKLAAKIAEDPATAWQSLSSGVQKKALEVLEPPGNLYKVDLPDDQIAKMLDWDKPLSEQPWVIPRLVKKLFGNCLGAT